MPDLVQRLRIHADSKHAGQQSIYTEAADLIEELEFKMNSKYWDTVKKDNDNLRKELDEHMDGFALLELTIPRIKTETDIFTATVDYIETLWVQQGQSDINTFLIMADKDSQIEKLKACISDETGVTWKHKYHLEVAITDELTERYTALRSGLRYIPQFDTTVRVGNNRHGDIVGVKAMLAHSVLALLGEEE